jgi:hypothetical protein
MATPRLAALVCVGTIEAIAHTTVLSDAEMLSEKMMKLLVTRGIAARRSNRCG